MPAILMIWLVAWLVSDSDHPWWWHAMVITLGYAVGRIVFEQKHSNKKVKTDV